MTTIEPPELPPLADYQKAHIFGPWSNVVIEAATKTGKTLGCVIWLYVMAWNGRGAGAEYWWVAPVYRQAKIAYRRLRRLLWRADPDHISWTCSDSELVITLVNGAVIRFNSADDPDNLYGEDVYAVVIDEATRCKAEAWWAIQSTLTATDGQVRIIGNVKGRRNWVYEIARKAQAGEPGWHYAKFTIDDAVRAGFVKAARVEQARRDLPEAVFLELFYAIPSEDGSNPFGLQHIAACVAPKSELKVVAFGVDLAKSQDWTVAHGLDVNGDTCQWYRWQGVSWDATITRLAGITGLTPALVDETGVGAPVVDQLKAKGGNITGYQFTAPSKQALMGRLAVAIQRREITFPDGPIKAELECFEYVHTAGGVKYSAPDGMHDDCVYALALAVMEWDKNRVPAFLEWDSGKDAPEPEPKTEAERAEREKREQVARFDRCFAEV